MTALFSVDMTAQLFDMTVLFSVDMTALLFGMIAHFVLNMTALFVVDMTAGFAGDIGSRGCPTALVTW